MPTKKAGGKGGQGKTVTDPELAGSNVLSVGEGVLLKWLSYHLEQANRVSNIVITIRGNARAVYVPCTLAVMNLLHHQQFITNQSDNQTNSRGKYLSSTVLCKVCGCCAAT